METWNPGGIGGLMDLWIAAIDDETPRAARVFVTLKTKGVPA
jgi:hypothetical protein